MSLAETLKQDWLNRWSLFYLLSVPLCLAMVLAMLNTDLSGAEGVSHMISFSVRWAVPFIFLVVATSSLQVLWPGAIPAWLLRNRKYIGLTFAVAMGWQGLFIYIMSDFHRDYYFEEVFYLRDELEGSTGYIFLAAMVVTSFDFARRQLSSAQWKLLHTSGLYFLWAYPFSVYWWNLYYYGNPVPLDYVFYWMGFSAFVLRIVAWGKKRKIAAEREQSAVNVGMPMKVMGVLLILLGILAAATGLAWEKPVSAFLLAPQWSATLELWLPYWPFQPFLPLFSIGLGVMALTTYPAARTSTAVSL